MRDWSAAHPLSFLVSPQVLAAPKTILEQALQLFVFSEALTLPYCEDYEQAAIFLIVSQCALHSASLPEAGDVQGLLMACTLSMFICWYCVAHIKAKEGMTYLALSCQLIAQLSRYESDGKLKEDRIRVQSLHGILSLMTVWAFSQLDRPTQPLSQLAQEGMSSMSRFHSSFSYMISSILANTSHPGPLATAMEDSALSLRSASEPMDMTNLFLQTSKDIVMLCIMTPRSESFTFKGLDLLQQCQSSLDTLKLFANEDQLEQRDSHMPGKIRMQRGLLLHKDRHSIALQCTLASLLYETLADIAIIMTSLAEQSHCTLDNVTRIYNLVESLLESEMTLISGTAKVQECLFELLWGELDWSIK